MLEVYTDDLGLTSSKITYLNFLCWFHRYQSHSRDQYLEIPNSSSLESQRLDLHSPKRRDGYLGSVMMPSSFQGYPEDRLYGYQSMIYLGNVDMDTG